MKSNGVQITIIKNDDETYKIIMEDEISARERMYDELEDAYLNILTDRDKKGLSIHY